MKIKDILKSKSKELVNIASENTTKLFDYPKIKSKQLKDIINLKIREKAIIATKARLIENSKNINDFSDEDLEIIIADEDMDLSIDRIIQSCEWIMRKENEK